MTTTEPAKRRRGQPAKIDMAYRTREDGTTVTVADQIIQGLQIGGYLEPSAAAAGVNRDSVYEWLRVAGRARIRAHGDITSIDLTDHETACIEFSDRVEEALGYWETGALGDLERLARGGIPQEVITVKVDADGRELERTTRTTYTLPDRQVLEWRLERRFQDRYGQRVELTGASGGPVVLSTEDRAEALLETARAAQARRTSAVPRAHRSRAKKPALP